MTLDEIGRKAFEIIHDGKRANFTGHCPACTSRETRCAETGTHLGEYRQCMNCDRVFFVEPRLLTFQKEIYV